MILRYPSPKIHPTSNPTLVRTGMVADGCDGCATATDAKDFLWLRVRESTARERESPNARICFLRVRLGQHGEALHVVACQPMRMNIVIQLVRFRMNLTTLNVRFFYKWRFL